jgi:hypothetical protein
LVQASGDDAGEATGMEVEKHIPPWSKRQGAAAVQDAGAFASALEHDVKAEHLFNHFTQLKLDLCAYFPRLLATIPRIHDRTGSNF